MRKIETVCPEILQDLRGFSAALQRLILVHVLVDLV